MQNGSFLVAGASAKDNEDRDQSSTLLATGWDFTGVPGQELVECVRVTDCLAALPELSYFDMLRICCTTYSTFGMILTDSAWRVWSVIAELRV